MNTSREMVPLVAADISTLCKNLRQQLSSAGHEAPGHVALLNMLAKSAGYRNYQMLKARPPLAPPVTQVPAVEAVTSAITLPRGSTCQ